MSSIVRPEFPISNNFTIKTEAGYVYNRVEDELSASGRWNKEKIAIAPTWAVHTSSWIAPEFRLLATYLVDSPFDEEAESEVLIGAQAEVSW